MKQGTEIKFQTSWQRELQESLRTATDLYQAGFISKSELPQYEKLLANYSFLLPRYYAGLIDKQDPHCPIRLQAIPMLEELEQKDEYDFDPLKDLQHQPAPKITHRYINRLLLHLTPNCSMYCRFCFRKSLLNEWAGELFEGSLEAAFAYIMNHAEVEEVIFSGGDPFMVTDSTLRRVILRLEDFAHITRIRFHTRVPVTFPVRVTNSLADLLSENRFNTVVVTHFNHPKELTPQAAEACHRLKQNEIVLLNQSVLLRGVNDRAETLTLLSKGLFEMGVLPYYLHHPDKAAGTQHFDVELEFGKGICRELQEKLPGYLVPRYVVDDGKHPYKVDL